MPRTINLNHITKIEGHARLHVVIDNGQVKKAKLKIFEGSRFFEGLLKGKKFDELPTISSRICGVCSVVHTIAAVKAIETAFNVKVSKQTDLLRELLNIGGTVQSHALHLFFLVLPDYFGFSSAIEMASEHKNLIRYALALKKAGNRIVQIVAGRDIHPISCVVGGFSRIPDKKRLKELIKELDSVKSLAKKSIKVFAELDYPHFDLITPHFALRGKSYFYSDDIIKCTFEGCVNIQDYESHFHEHFRRGSTAEFATKEGKSYMVGALPRVLISKDQLHTPAKYIKQLEKNRNSPYMNVLAQSIEIYEGIIRSIEILEKLIPRLKSESPVKFTPVEGEGIAAIEAPRGILFHRYKFNKEGICTYANLTTPTTQNLANMEDSIKFLVHELINTCDPKKQRCDSEIKLEIEKLIRAYDPCISCSTHFLELKWEEK